METINQIYKINIIIMINRNCKMIVELQENKKEDLQLLWDLFDQMLDYDQYKRMSIDQILKQKQILLKKEDRNFKMNDIELEVYVRDSQNKIQIQHVPIIIIEMKVQVKLEVAKWNNKKAGVQQYYGDESTTMVHLTASDAGVQIQ